MASVSRMFAKNLFPSPSPFEAPLTNPAISRISIVVGITRSGFTRLSKFSSLESGTDIVPILGSIVQNGKFADCAFALDKQLNKVDFPTLGSPTIPHFNDMSKFLDFKDSKEWVKTSKELSQIRRISRNDYSSFKCSRKNIP